MGIEGTSQQRQGVATPDIGHFDEAFERCCEALVKSHFERTLDGTRVGSHMPPSLARVSLANLGFLCLERLMQSMDAEGCLGACTSSCFQKEHFFGSCEKTLNLMIHELYCASNDSQKMQNWPPHEFQEDGASCVSTYFDGKYDLPFNWHFPLTDLKRKVFDIFEQLGDEQSFAVFVEIFAQELSPPMRQNLLTMLDNGEMFACFASVVSLFVNGDVTVETEEETLLYLPMERLFQVIEQSAAYAAPTIPEPVFMEIPKDLYEKITHTEETENSPGGKNNHETSGSNKTVNKRKPSQSIVELGKPSSERAKRTRSNAPKEETEELTKSKEFTSLLEALL